MFNSFATPWTVARQASLAMEFSRQEYWNGLPFPSTGDPPDPGIEPTSPADRFFTSEPPGKPFIFKYLFQKQLFLGEDLAIFIFYEMCVTFLSIHRYVS